MGKGGATIAGMAWLRGFGQFAGDMFRHWVGKMTGLLSIVLAVFPLAFPAFFTGANGLFHNRWMWWLAAAVSFLIASRAAWDQQRGARMKAETELMAAKEELADRVPRVKGEIVLGYLDIGKRYEERRLVPHDSNCVVTFYLRLVNHSNQDAWMVLPPALTLMIDGCVYPAEYVIPFDFTLTVNDAELRGDRNVRDIFQFSLGGLASGVLQKPRMHVGWLMFNLPDSRRLLEGKVPVVGSVGITLSDTLGGTHLVDNRRVEFRLNRIG